MRGFRFRAQPALDLRRRQDDEAQGALARADAALQSARLAFADACERVREAGARFGAVMCRRDGVAQQAWHRSWILRLEAERAACAAALAARESDRARAAEARARTHQQLETLQRLKGKAAHAWKARAAAEERKQLDSLATLRFVAGVRASDPANR